MSGTGQLPSVLVVDDEPSVRTLLRDLLELSGYRVSEASDGLEALAVLAADPTDAIVLDVMMPRLSGLETLARMRQRDTLSRLPVLLLSAADDDPTTWAGWRAGAHYYLTKPFEPEHLLAWLRRICLEPVSHP